MKIEHFCHGKNVRNALCFIKKISLQFINLFFLLETESLLSYMLQKFIIQTKAVTMKGDIPNLCKHSKLIKRGKKKKKIKRKKYSSVPKSKRTKVTLK